jgi:hypothetical protein
MEERFIKLGQEQAVKVSESFGIPNDDSLKLFCAEYQFKWFFADCSFEAANVGSEFTLSKASELVSRWVPCRILGLGGGPISSYFFVDRDRQVYHWMYCSSLTL